VPKRDPAQAAEHHISHCSKPQPQLIGAHRSGRSAVGEQIELGGVREVQQKAVRLMVMVCG